MRSTDGQIMKRFSGLEIDELIDGQRYTLVLGGELDIASAVTLHGAIGRVRATGAATSAIILDLSRLIFIDSTGLAEIILTGQLCEKDGYEFALIPGPRAVQRLFELTGLIDALPFVDARPAASLDGAMQPEIVSKQELEGT